MQALRPGCSAIGIRIWSCVDAGNESAALTAFERLQVERNECLVNPAPGDRRFHDAGHGGSGGMDHFCCDGCGLLRVRPVDPE